VAKAQISELPSHGVEVIGAVASSARGSWFDALATLSTSAMLMTSLASAGS
jgi:hypothetical protein